MNERDKRRQRKIKKIIKRTGNKRVRSKVKKEIAQNPYEINLDDAGYGPFESKKYNGMDHDATRKREN